MNPYSKISETNIRLNQNIIEQISRNLVPSRHDIGWRKVFKPCQPITSLFGTRFQPWTNKVSTCRKALLPFENHLDFSKNPNMSKASNKPLQRSYRRTNLRENLNKRENLIQKCQLVRHKNILAFPMQRSESQTETIWLQKNETSVSRALKVLEMG